MKDINFFEDYLNLAEWWIAIGRRYAQMGDRRNTLDAMFKGFECTQAARTWLKNSEPQR